MIHQYLARIHATLYARSDIEVEDLRLMQRSNEEGQISGRLRYYDGSVLEFREAFVVERRRIIKLDYSFHYQRPDGTCVVRYDNAPHHPQVSTFPDHKHMDDRIEAAEPPDLSEVLREIDGILYPQQRNDEGV
jgi:hypothetical protein